MSSRERCTPHSYWTRVTQQSSSSCARTPCRRRGCRLAVSRPVERHNRHSPRGTPVWPLVLLVGALALVAGGIPRRSAAEWGAAGHRRRTPRGWLGLVALGLGLVGVAVTTAALLGATTGRSTRHPSTQPVRPAALTPGVVPAPAVAVESARADGPAGSSGHPPIGVRTPLVELRVRRGVLQPPSDSARAGWYPRSATPGDLGAAVIVGDLDSKSGRAVFSGSARCAPATE